MWLTSKRFGLHPVRALGQEKEGDQAFGMLCCFILAAQDSAIGGNSTALHSAPIVFFVAFGPVATGFTVSARLIDWMGRSRLFAILRRKGIQATAQVLKDKNDRVHRYIFTQLAKYCGRCSALAYRPTTRSLGAIKKEIKFMSWVRRPRE